MKPFLRKGICHSLVPNTKMLNLSIGIDFSIILLEFLQSEQTLKFRALGLEFE